MRKTKGFSLIELLIVVAIIMIIAAVATPSFLRSRMAANESSAVASIRMITTAETTYAATYPDLGYTCTLTDLGPPASGNPISPTAADIIDVAVASGLKSGYKLALNNCSGTPATGYRSSAVPVTQSLTGTRSFCSDPSGNIMYAPDGQAATCQSAGVGLP